LPERYSVSVPPVTNNIYRSAAPAQNYLPERRSAAFRHHYSPGDYDLGRPWKFVHRKASMVATVTQVKT